MNVKSEVEQTPSSRDQNIIPEVSDVIKPKRKRGRPPKGDYCNLPNIIHTFFSQQVCEKGVHIIHHSFKQVPVKSLS